MFQSKRETIYLILAGIFITNAVVAELIGGKLITIGNTVMSIGILPWPVVFLTTDLINEYFGREGVRKLSFITSGLIAYCFFVLYIALNIPSATGFNTVNDEQFTAVFGQYYCFLSFPVNRYCYISLLQKENRQQNDLAKGNRLYSNIAVF